MNVTALMAIPGAGKTTWLEENLMHHALVISPDDIRLGLTGDMSDQTRNAEVFALAHMLMDNALRSGIDVVWDATNVTARARADILAGAAKFDASTTLVVLDVPQGVAWQRNGARERVVPEDVMDRMWDQFQESLSAIGHEAWDTIEFERWTESPD